MHIIFIRILICIGVSSMELRVLEHPLSSGTTASSVPQQVLIQKFAWKVADGVATHSKLYWRKGVAD